MWYETAKPFIESGDLAILGVVQEQHAERAQLYKQWKEFDFTIVQDATTDLNLNVVPIPILIDENGVVRDNRARPEKLQEFIDRKYELVTQATETSAPGSTPPLTSPTPTQAAALIASGNELLNFSKPQKVDQAIEAFKKAVELEPGSGKAHFSLGVAYRMRFDSPAVKPDDFQLASQNWSKALAIDPNQYIWRRRIEQYGPAMIKPYPFFEWVEQAIREIADRGDQPVTMNVRLTDAETARPAREFVADQQAAANPDPEAKVFPDKDGKIQVSPSVVPAIVKKGDPVRVHLQLTAQGGEFNHEAGPILLWIDEQSGGIPDKRLIEFTAGDEPAASKDRLLDFEFRTATDGGEKRTISGFLLCHVCDDDGVCFYLRRNFSIDIGLR